MKKVVIDGGAVKTMEDIHRTFAEALDFPEWYGGNLDALYDCLTDLFEETEIVIENRDALAGVLGRRCAGFWRVLCDAARENRRIRISGELFG